VHTCQVHLRRKFGDCRDNTHVSIFHDDVEPNKIGHDDRLAKCDHGSSGFVDRSVRARLQVSVLAVTICATLVNIQKSDSHRRIARPAKAINRTSEINNDTSRAHTHDCLLLHVLMLVRTWSVLHLPAFVNFPNPNLCPQ